MLILTDCLTEKLDEGCIKVANQLTMRIKKQRPETLIVSYRDRTDKSDIHLNLNKLFLNWSLVSLLRSRREQVLYIPFSSNTMASVIRTFLLSLYAPRRVNVLYVLQHPMKKLVGRALKWSGARVVTLAESAEAYYRENGNETLYIKAGVDLQKYQPVPEETKQQLRLKYGVPRDKKVVLHVGHLNSGRNVQKLTLISDEYHVLLVCSPRGAQDPEIRKQLEAHPNIRILDSFVDAIQEIYQLSDVYLFPVMEAEHCIDAPLSVLEAAACNLPVISTSYGELSALKQKDGFLFLGDCSCETLNAAVGEMSKLQQCRSREAVVVYDWDTAIEKLILGIGI